MKLNGNVRLDAALPPHLYRRVVSFMSQEDCLIDWLTVEEASVHPNLCSNLLRCPPEPRARNYATLLRGCSVPLLAAVRFMLQRTAALSQVTSIRLEPQVPSFKHLVGSRLYTTASTVTGMGTGSLSS